MQKLCPFCRRRILANEPTMRLIIGVVHEKCGLRRQRDSFQEEFNRISRFSRLSGLLQRMSNQMILMLENIIARGLRSQDHKEFCTEWGMINKTVLEFNSNWFLARHFLAQRNAIDRLLSRLKGYAIVMPRTASESDESNRLMTKILTTVTDYSISSIGSIGLRRKKTKPKPKEEYVEELKELVTKFDTTMRKALRKAREDFRKYSRMLKEEHALWLQKNLLKLNEYGLLEKS
jgi:hypothetical protein